ncbi:AAA family ATPase [uncultured Brevundimonas sp.]|uniref:AAA family ATPase n=1 Tax=uncultured Brevundimonas sp. TaxID=213418 RepID=UPI0025F24766|nr:AAA family ATPase [uncultured Brevundimonas sp.]
MSVALKAVPNGYVQLPVVDLARWADCEPPPRDFLIPGLIPNGCVTSLYGDGGSGKTMIALWLMVAMACRYGAKWMDETPLGFRSVGLFAEDDEAELVRRVHRLCSGLDVDFSCVAPGIIMVPGVGMDTIVAHFHADTGELVITPIMRSLIDKVRAEGASLLVLDYAAAVFGGNELDRSQVSVFMRWLNAVAREENIAILLLGHPSVDGMKSSRGTSGSTAWRNQARSFLSLTVDDVQDDPNGRRLLTLALTKSNYSRAGCVFNLTFDGTRFEVLSASDGPLRGSKRPRLPRSQKVALDSLQRAVVDEGISSPGGGVPADARCVQLNRWREYSFQSGISQTDTPYARKKAFSRAAQDLLAKGLVGVCEPWVWAQSKVGQ